MDLTSKLSMYDFFAILLPSFLILLLLVCFFCWDYNSAQGISGDIYTLAIIVTLSYLIGIVYHKLIEYIYGKSGLRNNEECIKKQLTTFNKWLSRHGLDVDFEGKTGVMVKYYEAYYLLMGKIALIAYPYLKPSSCFYAIWYLCSLYLPQWYAFVRHFLTLYRHHLLAALAQWLYFSFCLQHR